MDISTAAAIAAGLNALAAIAYSATAYCDFKRRNKILKAGFITVPNRNESGIDEYRLASHPRKIGTVAKDISIFTNGTVLIEQENGEKISFPRFINWKP